MSAPLRPDASGSIRPPGTAGRGRWLPAAGVLGVLIVTSLGGYAVSAALSEPAGPRVSIPGEVSLQPLSGWEPTDAGVISGRPVVRVTRGSGTLALVAWGPVAGDAASLATEVVDVLLRDQLDRLSVSEEFSSVATGGLEGERFTFVGIDRGTGVAVEGEITAVVTSAGRGVVFVGFAPEGSLAFVDDDLHSLISAASFGPGA
ncbi:MAG TPA: hypothetical protein VNC60_10030 [Actinomycetota bacterium]|nr:hypothetical protein [Actinomycetota bacterium]